MREIKPNFFVVGAAKAGTTALYNMLCQSEEVYFPAIKEPQYFSYRHLEFPLTGPGDQLKSQFVHCESDYLRLFSGATGCKAIGEASATYLYVPQVAEDIFLFNRNAKIIACLRDPIDRAFSAYMHLVRDGRESYGFEEALKLEPYRIKKNYGPLWHYKSMGMYSEQVERFFNVFGKENVLVISYEELRSRPRSVLEQIGNFLALDLSFISNIEIGRSNVSGLPRSRMLAKVLSSRRMIKKLGVNRLPLRLRKSVRNWVTSINTGDKPEMRSNEMDLLRPQFERDIKTLEAILGKRLWDYGSD